MAETSNSYMAWDYAMVFFPRFSLGSHPVAITGLACLLAAVRWTLPVAASAEPSASNALATSAQSPRKQAGGGAQADFDSLIDLIVSTVDPESWQENGSGQGDITPFAINGVSIDAHGSLQFVAPSAAVPAASFGPRSIVDLRGPVRQPPQGTASATSRGKISPERAAKQRGKGPFGSSPCRVISLRRLQSTIEAHQRQWIPLDESMLTLAGMRTVRWVFVDESNDDILLAGPAGDWTKGRGGVLLASDTGTAVVRLDDLLDLWRRERSQQGAPFGCSIVPRQEALANAQNYLERFAKEPLEPSDRESWLRGLRGAIGEQDVEFYRVDPNSRVAGVLLAADHHMKLIGMGLAQGVPGVQSYLASVRLTPEGAPPPTKVLRWWFSMPPIQVEVDAARTMYSLPPNCFVQTLSENELLAARGERIHTGESDALNQQFAQSFTKRFDALATAYPVYSELQRLFEAALLVSLIEREGLAERAGWEPTLLCDAERLRLPRMRVAQKVETVINHRILAQRHIVVGVSGGAWADSVKALRLIEANDAIESTANRPDDLGNAPTDDDWWWDAPSHEPNRKPRVAP